MITDDTAAGMIARLDAALARRGQRVTLTNFSASSVSNVPASVRPVRASEMIGNVTQTHSKVVVSPTLIGSLLPLKKGDKCTIDGKARQIEFYAPITVGSSIVRIELTVAG